ncbi:hypothetical protein HMI54_012110 [Coelomomyces lativittatus]|nr:hypothetical protein HMI56_005319 [Coelomomyces lativittatus]KAJ1513479.1 hypothetical protein HMI55_005538 [Coelomomyces lativittatus]KAJ1515556.1 hypothetical protein HMI54_012110 [Coelomomyces lativittatus]
MESLFTNHLSPSNDSHFSSSPKPIFTEEIRLRKRIRANFNNHLEELPYDENSPQKVKSENKKGQKSVLQFRTKFRKSSSIDIHKTSVSNLSKNSLSDKSLKTQQKSSGHANTFKHHVSTTDLSEQKQSQSQKRHCSAQNSNDAANMHLCTKKGYDVNLVREYMKQKRKEKKSTNQTELLKGIFKPLHHVSSPPRPAAQPKEIRQQLQRYIVQRKEKEKKKTLEHLRELENEKKKKDEVLAALDKARRFKLEEHLKLLQDNRAKKKPQFHDKITSVLLLDTRGKEENLESITSPHQSAQKNTKQSQNEIYMHRQLSRIELHDARSPHIHNSEFQIDTTDFLSNQPNSPSQNQFLCIVESQKALRRKRKTEKHENLLIDFSNSFGKNIFHENHSHLLNDTKSSDKPQVQRSFHTSQIKTTTFDSSNSVIEDKVSIQANADPTEDRLIDFDIDDPFSLVTPPPKCGGESLTEHTRCFPHDFNDNLDYYRPLNIYSRFVSSANFANETRSTFASMKNNFPSPQPSLISLTKLDEHGPRKGNASPFTTHSPCEQTFTPKAQILCKTPLISSPIHNLHEDGFDNFLSTPAQHVFNVKENPSSKIKPPPADSRSKNHSPQPRPIELDKLIAEPDNKLSQTLSISADIVNSVQQFQKTIRKDFLNINELKGNDLGTLNAKYSTLHCGVKDSPCKNNNYFHPGKTVQSDTNLELASKENYSFNFSSKDIFRTEAFVQKMVKDHLTPLIEEIENKLQRLQLLLSKENTSLNLKNEVSPSCSHKINDFEIENSFSQPILPMPVLDNSPIPTKSYFSSFVLHSPPAFESELSFIHPPTSKFAPRICDNNLIDLSTTIDVTINSESKHNASYLGTLPKPDSNFDSALTPFFENPSGGIEDKNKISLKFGDNNIQRTESPCNTGGYGKNLNAEIIPVSVSEECFIENSFSGSSLSSLSSIVEEKEEKESKGNIHSVINFNTFPNFEEFSNELVGRFENSRSGESEVLEESILAPSPNFSKLFADTDIQFSDTFISCTNSLELPEVQIEKRVSSSRKLPGPFLYTPLKEETDNILKISDFVSEEALLIQSSKSSLKINTGSDSNPSEVSSIISFKLEDQNFVGTNMVSIENAFEDQLENKEENDNSSKIILEEVCEDICEKIELHEDDKREGPPALSIQNNQHKEVHEFKMENNKLCTSVSIPLPDVIDEIKNISPVLSIASFEEPVRYNIIYSATSNKSPSLNNDVSDPNLEINSIDEECKKFGDDDDITCSGSVSSDIEDCLSKSSEIFSESFAIEMHEIPFLPVQLSDNTKDESPFLTFPEPKPLHPSGPSIFENDFFLNSEGINSNQVSHNFAIISQEMMEHIPTPVRTSFVEEANSTPPSISFEDNSLNLTEKKCIENAIQSFLESIFEETSRSVLGTDFAISPSSFQFRGMGYAEQYIKFLILHHNSSISLDTKFDTLKHPLFKDIEYNSLLTKVVQEFHLEWFRRSKRFLTQNAAVPACIFYRALLNKLRRNTESNNTETLLQYEVQQKLDSTALIEFSSFLEEKMEVSMKNLVDQLIDATLK